MAKKKIDPFQKVKKRHARKPPPKVNFASKEAAFAIKQHIIKNFDPIKGSVVRHWTMVLLDETAGIGAPPEVLMVEATSLEEALKEIKEYHPWLRLLVAFPGWLDTDYCDQEEK